MGDTRTLGGWKSCRARGSRMLDFGGGGERWAGQWSYGDGYGHNRCALKSSFEAKEGFVVRRRSSSASRSSFCPPPRSLPALQRAPSTISCSIIPPLDTPTAPHQSIASPSPILVVLVVFFVVLVVARLAFRSPSRAKMAADVESPDVLHILGVYRSRVWRRLAPISM